MAFVGGLFGGLDKLFGGGKNPADAAQPYYDKAAQTEKQYLDPFVQRGGRAGDILEDRYGQMAQDPAAMLEQFMQGYQPSKGYQMQQERMGTAAANTAAAGGMRGSPQEQAQQQELTQGLLSKDMQQYLQNVLGLQGAGLQGEHSLYGTGAQMAQGLAGDLSNIYGTQGQLAFQGGREGQQRKQDILSALMGIGGMAGGAMLGGVPGAAVGSKLGNFFGGGR